jgi:hypothetical protein
LLLDYFGFCLTGYTDAHVIKLLAFLLTSA